MYTQTLILLSSVAGIVLAEPIPQAAATTSFDPSAFATDTPDFDTSSFDSALDSALASFTGTGGGIPGVPSYYSDFPTPAPSLASIIASASPTDDTSDPCATTDPAWVQNLPSDAQDAIHSYESAVASWASKHSSELAADATGPIVSDICNSDGGSGSAPTDTGAGGADVTSPSGGQTTAAPGGSSGGAGGTTNTAKGNPPKTGTSSGLGSKPTGAVAAGFAGVVGMIGLMVAL